MQQKSESDYMPLRDQSALYAQSTLHILSNNGHEKNVKFIKNKKKKKKKPSRVTKLNKKSERREGETHRCWLCDVKQREEGEKTELMENGEGRGLKERKEERGFSICDGRFQKAAKLGKKW